LDAALGSGSNLALVRQLVARCPVPVQVGGGARSGAAVAALLEAGAARAIVGARAVGAPAWLARTADMYPGQRGGAGDVEGGMVVSRGWTESTALGALELLSSLDDVPLAGVLVTDVSREGRLAGMDTELFQRLTRVTPHPLLAAGGVTALGDLEALRSA